MDDAFFIDREGNKIYSDTIASHIGLANLIIKNNQQLSKEYELSKRKDKVDFLIYEKGYVTISNIAYYRKIKFSSLSISERQREIIEYYCKRGYDVDDLALEHLNELEER